MILSNAILINPIRTIEKNSSNPFIAMEDIEPNYRFVKSKTNRESRSGSKFKNGDTLFARITPSLENGKTAYVDSLEDGKIGIGSTEFIVLSGKSGITENLFVYYLARTSEFRNAAIQSMTGTSGRQRVQETVFDNFEMEIPDINNQLKISNILGNLDNKIKNLRDINLILEQIIQSIFKSWFIDFDGVTEFEDSELGKIPKGWQIGILENFLDLTKGVSYKSQDLKFSNKALVTLKSVKRGGGYTNIGLKSFDGKYNENQVVKENDIIVAQTDLTQNADVIGKPALIRDSKHFDILVASLDIVIIKIKNNKILKFYIYYLFLTDRFQNHVYGYTSGTTVLHLAKDAIPNFVFILPPTKTLEKFDKLISTWIQKNHENNNQIENLTKVRDFLLPKLMSGEIQV